MSRGSSWRSVSSSRASSRAPSNALAPAAAHRADTPRSESHGKGVASARRRRSVWRQSRWTCRPITTAATRCAPASLSAAAALWALAPLVQVSSMRRTDSPCSGPETEKRWRSKSVEKPRRRSAAAAAGSGCVPAHHLPDDPPQGVLARAPACPRAPLVTTSNWLVPAARATQRSCMFQMPPEDCRQGQAQRRGDRLPSQALVAREHVMELLVRDAVGDRGDGVEPVAAPLRRSSTASNRR